MSGNSRISPSRYLKCDHNLSADSCGTCARVSRGFAFPGWEGFDGLSGETAGNCLAGSGARAVEMAVTIKNATATRREKSQRHLLGVRYASAKRRDSLAFIGKRRNRLYQPRKLEHFTHMSGRIQQFQTAALPLQRHKGTHQRADPRAIHLRDGHQIYNHFRRSCFGKLAQFSTQRIVARPDNDSPHQIHDHDVIGFSRRNLQAHVPLPGRARDPALTSNSPGGRSARFTSANAKQLRKFSGAQLSGRIITLSAVAKASPANCATHENRRIATRLSWTAQGLTLAVRTRESF